MSLLFIIYRDEAAKIAEYLRNHFEFEEVVKSDSDLYFAIKAEDSGIIAYDFIPEQYELAYLPNVVKSLFGNKIADIGVKIDIYVTNFCTFCPRVVENIAKLAAKNSDAKIFVRDATKTSFQTVPAITLNDTFTFLGNVDPQFLISLAKGDRVRDYIEQALTNKQIDFAEKVVKAGYAKDLIAVLKEGNFVARMGAIILIERLKNSAIVDSLRQSLRDIILSNDFRAADDAIMALSYIMNSDDMKFLENAMDKVDEKIREAIKDVLDLD